MFSVTIQIQFTMQAYAMNKKLRSVGIKDLHPYLGFPWSLKARVISKSPLKQFVGPRGEGEMFSFDIKDSEDKEIKVSCFNKLCKKYYESVEVLFPFFFIMTKFIHFYSALSGQQNVHHIGWTSETCESAVRSSQASVRHNHGKWKPDQTLR